LGATVALATEPRFERGTDSRRRFWLVGHLPVIDLHWVEIGYNQRHSEDGNALTPITISQKSSEGAGN